MKQKKEVIIRVEYFITNYLPWLLVFLLLVGICICIFHYKKKTCFFEKEKNKEDNDNNLLSYHYIDLEE